MTGSTVRELVKGQERLFAARCRGGRTSWNVSRVAVRERPVRRPVLFFEEAVTKSTEETSRELEASRIMPTKPSRKPEASRRVWPS